MHEIKLVEVGLRDGLQNETRTVPTYVKLNLIQQLIDCGLKTIEVTSFVSPRKVPQMADHEELLQQLTFKKGIHYPVLIPNRIGMERALKVGVKDIAIFTSASETFSQRNTNCSIKESLQRFAEVLELAAPHKIPVRGYLSCVMGCPYEGEVNISQVADIADKLYQMGCYEISLGDTIGVGTILKTKKLINAIKEKIPLSAIAVHFHDTYGQALANIYVALEAGIRVIDASVAGLGGCPYARGATGNVATEDVVYMLEGLGFSPKIDMVKLAHAGKFICDYLGHETRSKVGKAILRAGMG